VVRDTYGIFTSAHAAAVGLQRQQRSSRLTHREWITLYDEVYRLAAVAPSWRGDLLAACWAGGFRAVASHRSAAALWDLPGGRRHLPEITCPRWRRAHHRDGLVVHESNALDFDDCTFVDGIPVTGPELTLLGIAAVCSPSVLEMAADAAEHRRLTTPAALRALVGRLGGRGRRGVGRLRALLDVRDPACGVAESVQETRLRQALRAAGLPEPVMQFEVRHAGTFVARVDAAYPEHRIAIEYDSYRHHGGRGAIDRDGARRSRLLAVGWLPFTATHAELSSGCRTLAPALAVALRRPNPNELASSGHATRDEVAHVRRLAG
jgi:hypothetical protein